MGYEGNLKSWDIKTSPDPQVFGTVLKVMTFDRYDMKGLDKKTFTVYNGGVGALVLGVVESSPDNTNWGTVDGTSFAGLGSGCLAYGYYESTDRYWRFKATSANTGTTIAGTASGTVITGTLSGWWTF